MRGRQKYQNTHFYIEFFASLSKFLRKSVLKLKPSVTNRSLRLQCHAYNEFGHTSKVSKLVPRHFSKYLSRWKWQNQWRKEQNPEQNPEPEAWHNLKESDLILVSENSKKSITAVFKTTENKKESECNQRNSRKRPDLVWFCIYRFLGNLSARYTNNQGILFTVNLSFSKKLNLK